MTSTSYPNSIVLGLGASHAVVYHPGDAGHSPTVDAVAGSALLTSQPTAIITEHRDASLPGLIVACVSGTGQSTNVVSPINLGVISQSAAVLFGAQWTTVDSASAWAQSVASGVAWSGWENCGVKPEGLPSRSSQLVPSADGGYVEDVFDGNPGTTFLAIRRVVTAAQATALLSDAGQTDQDDPARPLVIRMRAYGDGAGHIVFVQTGLPVAGAPAGARGFIALYTR